MDDVPPALIAELNEKDLADCERGRFSTVAVRLRRRGWVALSLGVLSLITAPLLWFYRETTVGRYTFVIVLVALFSFECLGRSRALLRRADRVSDLARGRC